MRTASTRSGARAAGLIAILALTMSAPAVGRTTTTSPAQRAQARRLYAPLSRYERSVTPAQRAQQRRLVDRFSTQVNRCQRPYQKQLIGVSLSSKRYPLTELWQDATLLQNYQADVTPYAPHLALLARAWQALSLRDRPMDTFAHGVASELQATLTSSPLNSCAFVRAIAAHHFSYAWARHSAAGTEAHGWMTQMLRAGHETDAFWRRAFPTTPLFTKSQLTALANIPGEIG